MNDPLHPLDKLRIKNKAKTMKKILPTQEENKMKSCIKSGSNKTIRRLINDYENKSKLNSSFIKANTFW